MLLKVAKQKPTAHGLANWSVQHPIAVIMITLAVMLISVFSLDKLNIDLLPHIIYPEIRVRVVDPGVPASVMEDEITRQLEEQLAITEDATHIESTTREGRSAVDLSFEYGKDIDIALRDASTRLDRAKRFLPDSIDPPVIYKRDPSQLPVAEYIVSSSSLDPAQLRRWVDYRLAKWLVNQPGVAAAEVGGGQEREIQIITHADRLTSANIDILDIANLIRDNNQDISAGRLHAEGREISGRTQGRYSSLEDIKNQPIRLRSTDGQEHTIRLNDVADIIDGYTEERLKIRLNGLPGIKLSIQKQPQANTVTVVDAVNDELERLQNNQTIPESIVITAVNDEARYIRRSLDNASSAALGGMILAMITVLLFLGNIRRTLIIGSAIPIAILVTVMLMALGGLSLNTMTLGGLALGIGMLVDSSIVVLENIFRHQTEENDGLATQTAVSEVSSAIIASTSTNLAAVLPFLFIGGLIGLLFSELIFTISAAIIASLVVSMTLIPALANKLPPPKTKKAKIVVFPHIQNLYRRILSFSLKQPWLVIALFVTLLILYLPDLLKPAGNFLPRMDDGRIAIHLTTDKGTHVNEMDKVTRQVEKMVQEQGDIEHIFTTVGGFVFGRSKYETANRANILVQLTTAAKSDSKAWIKKLRKTITDAKFVGVKVRIRSRGIRGLRLGNNDQKLTFRVRGENIRELEKISQQISAILKQQSNITNIENSSEEQGLELNIAVNKKRAKDFDLTVRDIGQAVRYALEGSEVTSFIENDQRIDINLRIDRQIRPSPDSIGQLIIFSKNAPKKAIRLSDLADIKVISVTADILRDQQQRIVEVTANLENSNNIADAIKNALAAFKTIELPKGYDIYEAGDLEKLEKSQRYGYLLLGLALFLVLVVMAVQYESLRNPLIIIFSVVFATIGVALGLRITDTSISMPVWLGLIMLAGIVVNNAIVLVEFIEIQRTKGQLKLDAIISAATLRLRPILMTSLTTVFGMLPLAMALGEGSELLQPLAVTIVSGLSFSILVSLFLVPAIYRYLGKS